MNQKIMIFILFYFIEISTTTEPFIIFQIANSSNLLIVKNIYIYLKYII